MEAVAEAQEAVPFASEAPAVGNLLFDHLGLVVPELCMGRTFLSSALGVAKWTPEVEDRGIGVRVQFGTSGRDGLVYELVAPLGECSPIANALRNGKHILNHVAYRTAELDEAGARLRAQGCCPAGAPQPAVAYEGRRVQFFVSPLRFVIELIEKPDHMHTFEDLRSAEML
jgi:methylmalonyl-CoA/ethylmalonyl-CoA epimerase